MTRQRRHGSDTCFGDWLRSQKDIDSRRPHYISVNDVDFMFHKYRHNEDSLGTRPVHLMMSVEVKILGGMPEPHQLQTLFFQHQMTKKKCKMADAMAADGSQISVWSFGVFVCSCPGFYPGEDDRPVRWHSFDDVGRLSFRQVDEELLKAILRFDVEPDTLNRLDLRRHHKTQQLLQEIELPLPGLGTVEKPVTLRS